MDTYFVYFTKFKNQMMKKILPFTLLLALFISCDKIDELTQFHVDYTTAVTVPATSVISLPFDMFTPDIESNSESTFSVNDTRTDLVEKVTLEELKLTLVSPETADFSFLESIEIYISADGLEETKIAWKNNIAEEATTTILELETSDEDVKAYIKKEDFQLRVNTVTDELIDEDHEIDVYADFFVDAKILGI